MKHILIDTCSLRHLIDRNFYSQYIIQLNDLINQGKLSLIVHNNIFEEWEKHKIKWRRDIERKLNFTYQNSLDSENLPIIYNNPKQHLEEQISSFKEWNNNRYS